MADAIDAILAELLERTGASRVTLRQNVPGEYAFPVTHEALEVAAGRQVVQDDCATAYDDPAFHRMRETYGGLAAQIVTPVMLDGAVAGIVSLHQLGEPRRWTSDEIETCRAAAASVGELL